MKVSYSRTCAQHLVSGSEVRIALIDSGPFGCLMATGVEYHG
jgi:hypothetical protein